MLLPVAGEGPLARATTSNHTPTACLPNGLRYNHQNLPSVPYAQGPRKSKYPGFVMRLGLAAVKVRTTINSEARAHFNENMWLLLPNHIFSEVANQSTYGHVLVSFTVR